MTLKSTILAELYKLEINNKNSQKINKLINDANTLKKLYKLLFELPSGAKCPHSKSYHGRAIMTDNYGHYCVNCALFNLYLSHKEDYNQRIFQIIYKLCGYFKSKGGGTGVYRYYDNNLNFVYGNIIPDNFYYHYNIFKQYINYVSKVIIKYKGNLNVLKNSWYQ